jgi:hypothetical protein
MGEFLATLLLLVLALLWMVAWKRRRHFAVGALVGAIVAPIAYALLPPVTLKTMPIWLPALPFGIVAVTLLCFGVLAWIWGEG